MVTGSVAFLAGVWLLVRAADLPDALLVQFLPVAAGKASLPVKIPNSPTVKGVHIYSQFVVDDPTLGGFTVTQGGVIRPQ